MAISGLGWCHSLGGAHVIGSAAPCIGIVFVAHTTQIAEQAAIVRFLDHADRRIRRYLRAQQQLIALLEEQKHALIHQAVTGQIDVRTGRPFPAYKPSGVEWLGEVPERWQVCRSKRMFRPRRELARPNDIQLSATQAYGVKARSGATRRGLRRKVVRILRHLEKRRHVDLVMTNVMSMRSFQGGLERAWESGCIRSIVHCPEACDEAGRGVLRLPVQVSWLYQCPTVNCEFHS